MKVNLAYKFKTLDGKVIKDPEGKEFTLSVVVQNALLGMYNDEKIDGNEKAKRYMLSVKVYEAKDVIDLKSEDIALIKELIGKTGAPLVVGQAYEVLEGKNQKVEEGKKEEKPA